MKRNTFLLSITLFAAFVLWTAAVQHLDVRCIGPNGSAVGFAALNGAFHNFTGVHMTLYTVTDWLGLVPVAFGFAFAILGLVQWIRRRSILRVDFSILVLGGFYLAVLAAYLLFESYAVNYRPVLIGGFLEASYPSSTTLLVLCVMGTALRQLHSRIQNRKFRTALSLLIRIFIAFLVVGRLLSGVHWLTDIIGGILLSAALLVLYDALCSRKPDFFKT